MNILGLLRKTRVIISCVLLITASAAYAKDLILSAPPRETAEKGRQLYQPLANTLSQLLHRKVTYQHPGNWLNYQNKMRKDTYDIVFDGPHFVSWRIAHLGHEVLVKLPGVLKFMLVTPTENTKVNTAKDMVGKIFCGISPPNLSSLSFLGSFRNPMVQPRVKGIHGGMDKVYKAFKNNECEAAVFRNVFYDKKLSQQEKDKLKMVFTSEDMPNQAISVSKRLSRQEKNTIISALTLGEGVTATQGIVKRFAGKKVIAFIKANDTEYEGYNQLLEGIIFGW